MNEEIQRVINMDQSIAVETKRKKLSRFSHIKATQENRWLWITLERERGNSHKKLASLCARGKNCKKTKTVRMLQQETGN